MEFNRGCTTFCRLGLLVLTLTAFQGALCQDDFWWMNETEVFSPSLEADGPDILVDAEGLQNVGPFNSEQDPRNSRQIRGGSCPSVSPRQSCPLGSAGSNCWSPGQLDIDCPDGVLCCFDGCANVCQGSRGGQTRPSVPSVVYGLPASSSPGSGSASSSGTNAPGGFGDDDIIQHRGGTGNRSPSRPSGNTAQTNFRVGGGTGSPSRAGQGFNSRAGFGGKGVQQGSKGFGSGAGLSGQRKSGTVSSGTSSGGPGGPRAGQQPSSSGGAVGGQLSSRGPGSNVQQGFGGFGPYKGQQGSGVDSGFQGQSGPEVRFESSSGISGDGGASSGGFQVGQGGSPKGIHQGPKGFGGTAGAKNQQGFTGAGSQSGQGGFGSFSSHKTSGGSNTASGFSGQGFSGAGLVQGQKGQSRGGGAGSYKGYAASGPGAGGLSQQGGGQRGRGPAGSAGFKGSNVQGQRGSGAFSGGSGQYKFGAAGSFASPNRSTGGQGIKQQLSGGPSQQRPAGSQAGGECCTDLGSSEQAGLVAGFGNGGQGGQSNSGFSEVQVGFPKGGGPTSSTGSFGQNNRGSGINRQRPSKPDFGSEGSAPRFPSGRPKSGSGGFRPPPVPVSCPAAMLCIRPEYCDSKGFISNQRTDIISSADVLRVPQIACQDEDTSDGVCCIDPNYVDPWPQNTD